MPTKTDSRKLWQYVRFDKRDDDKKSGNETYDELSEKAIMDVALTLAILSLGAAVAVPIALYWHGQRHGQLTYEILSRNSIVPVLDDPIELVVGNYSCRSAYVVDFRLVNSGYRDFKIDDFGEPVKIQCDNPILAAGVLKMKPETRTAASIEINDKCAVLQAVALNRGDWLLIQLVTETCPTIEVIGHVSGGLISPYNLKHFKTRLWIALICAIVPVPMTGYLHLIAKPGSLPFFCCEAAALLLMCSSIPYLISTFNVLYASGRDYGAEGRLGLWQRW